MMRDWEKFAESLSVEQGEYLKKYLKNVPNWLLDSFQMITVSANAAFVEEGEPAGR